jgi:hypothetical protein
MHRTHPSSGCSVWYTVFSFLIFLLCTLVPRNDLAAGLLHGLVPTSSLGPSSPSLPSFSGSCELAAGALADALALAARLPPDRSALLLAGLPGERALGADSPAEEAVQLGPSGRLCVAVLVRQPALIPVNFYNASSAENSPGEVPAESFVRAFLELGVPPAAAPPDSLITQVTFQGDDLQHSVALTLRSPVDGHAVPDGQHFTLYIGSAAAHDMAVAHPGGGAAALECYLLFRAYSWQLMGVAGGFPMAEDISDAPYIYTRPWFEPQLVPGPRLRLDAAAPGASPLPLRACATALEGSTGFWAPEQVQGRVGPTADGLFWQPAACALRTFTSQAATQCLERYQLALFAGDSLIRRVFKTFLGYTPGFWAAPEATSSGWCYDRRKHHNCECEDYNEERESYDSHLVGLGETSTSSLLLRFHFGLLSGTTKDQEMGLLRAPFNDWASWLESMAKEREGKPQQPPIALVFDFVHWDLTNAAPSFALFLEEVELLAVLMRRLAATGGVRLIWYKPIWPVRGESSHNATFWLSLGTSMMFADQSERVLREGLGNALDVLDVQGMMQSHGLAASMATLARCSSGHLDSLEVEVQAQVLLNAMCSETE